MQKPRLFRSIESHFPEKLTDRTKKFNGYARSLGESVYKATIERGRNCLDNVDILIREVEKFREEIYEKD